MQDLIEQGEPPQFMLERPTLFDWNGPVWEAYRRCQGGRQLGMVAGDISLQELEVYCRMRGITDVDEIDELVFHFGELDRALRDLTKSASAERPDSDKGGVTVTKRAEGA